MTTAVQARTALAAVLSPRSVAIIGFSARPGGAGHNTHAVLDDNGFDGTVHLVGREAGTFA